ncbi:MAG: NAD(P)/FAD-dependent oxidoreductase [Pirellulaceae bacterium]
MDYDVVVIGAGAAGLFAAIRAAERGRRTLLLEKNRRPGVKILMSGGTRCNLTHNTDVRGIVSAYGKPGRFLHSPLATLGPSDVVAFFEAEGVATKIESTGKVFPQSNRAADVLAALLSRLRRTECELALEEPLTELTSIADGFRLVTSRRTLTAAHVIVTTGGKSYPGSGTTGDGYAWCEALGHTIVPPRPALTPITTNDEWVRELTGVTIEDVDVRVVDPDPSSASNQTKKKKEDWLARQRGSFLFTHFGLSGPAVLDVSRAVTGHAQPHRLLLVCDFLPAKSAEQLLDEFKRFAADDGKKQVVALLAAWAPRRLAEALLAQAQVPLDLRAAEASKDVWRRVVGALKQQPIHISGARGFKKAEVTAGGVALGEVDSRTMESRVCPGLYLAGEILDLDGPIGGYNFQAAFSTGWLAGSCA